MNMVFCRGCGKEIHETATSCPSCGAIQFLIIPKTSEQNRSKEQTEKTNLNTGSIIGSSIIWTLVFWLSLIIFTSMLAGIANPDDAQRIGTSIGENWSVFFFKIAILLSLIFTYLEKLPNTSGAQEKIKQLIPPQLKAFLLNKSKKNFKSTDDLLSRENRIILRLQKELNRKPTEEEIQKAKWDGLEL